MLPPNSPLVHTAFPFCSYRVCGPVCSHLVWLTPCVQVSPAAFTSAWNSYSAHRSLALASTCVPQAMGVSDNGEEISFHYEHIPARSLSSLMYDCRVRKPQFVLGENSALFRHWAREVLISLEQLSSQCPFVLLNAHSIGPENFMVARQGTSARLGRLLWGNIFDPSVGATPSEFFRERECALLRGFGKILRALLSCEREEDSVTRFVPDGDVVFDGKKMIADEQSSGDLIGAGQSSAPLVFPATVQVGQRLIIKLPPVNTVPLVLNDSGGNLGQKVAWQKAVVGKVGGTGEKGEGVPMQVVSNTMKNVLEIDAWGNAVIEVFACKAGLCEICIPFYDPSLKEDEVKGSCMLSVACEVVEQPCSHGLSAIMRGCMGVGGSKMTLKVLLAHKYFESLSVGDLEQVMSAYESHFADSNGVLWKAGGDKRVIL